MKEDKLRDNYYKTQRAHYTNSKNRGQFKFRSEMHDKDATNANRSFKKGARQEAKKEIRDKFELYKNNIG